MAKAFHRSNFVWLIGVALALILLTSGCALSFGYRHADWLISRQLDHYLDLTSSQLRIVKHRLHPLLLRHQKEALPQYEQFLTDLHGRISRGLKSEDLDWTFAAYDRFRADLFERAIPEGGPLAALLKEKQIHYLERVFRKEDAQAEHLTQGATAVRLDERTRRGVAMAEEWLGPLTREQTASLRTMIAALPDSQPVWWRYRKQRHEELVALLRTPASDEEITGTLRNMFVYPDPTASPGYLKMMADMRAALTGLVLEVDRMLTPLQRRHALLSIQKVIDELHALRRDP
ncbi:MAG: hypothetical protein GDA65_07030 [Nitrospira sp. CR1.1]|jgi:hypothetical protein|nr:hypothetical protein [Nitrospira sp. CR1.1]